MAATSEEQLAAAVSAWLRTDGWRTYHEVPFGAGRIDIVAVRCGRLVWAIETKLRGGLEVIDQALERRRCGASSVLVACPRAKGGALARVAGELGIGVIEVVDEHGKLEPRLASWPVFYRHAGNGDLIDALRPEYENQAAGKPGGHPHWTPFKGFVRDFIAALSRISKPVPLGEAAGLEAITRYKPEQQLSQLKRYLIWSIEAGLVPGTSIRGAGKTREVVFDRGAVTVEQRRNFQLHF